AEGRLLRRLRALLLGRCLRVHVDPVPRQPVLFALELDAHPERAHHRDERLGAFDVAGARSVEKGLLNLHAVSLERRQALSLGLGCRTLREPVLLQPRELRILSAPALLLLELLPFELQPLALRGARAPVDPAEPDGWAGVEQHAGKVDSHQAPAAYASAPMRSAS